MRYIAKGLQIFGALSLAAVIAALGYLTYAIASNVDRENVATKRSVAFVLNWGGLSTSQEYKVLSSFESARSFTGDHLDHYCIQISNFSPSDNEKENWQQVSSLGSPAKEAAIEAQKNGNASECFARDITNSDKTLAYVWSATLHSSRITAYDIILFDPQTKRLLYVSDKT
ncbi:hypothetical protein [Viridibacterium curvum]|uniref:Uncharacterized protein n=1 Tax=Viridibacterium curvum TaxID=1101404 RepID=A0ABP9R3G7_9RHOO